MTPTNSKQRQVFIWLGAVAVALSLGALAFWGAFLAQEGNLQEMFPWQLAKLRLLLIVSGAWLTLVGILFLPVGYLSRNRTAAEIPTTPPREKPRIAALLLLLLIASYVAAYGWLASERHNRFNSTGYDLAIKEQVLWNTAHGRFFASSLEVENALADHFQPLMLALVPLYATLPSPELLLWIQTLALAAGAVPLYRLAQRRLNSTGLALVLAAAYLLYPATGFVNRFDFHPEVLAIPAFIAAFDALEGDNLKGASLWLLVPLLSKENLGFSVAAFGLYAALFRRRVRFGLAWAGVGLAVSSATMFWLIPSLRHGPSDTLARYGWLGETPGEMVRTLLSRPQYVWQHLAEPNRGLCLLQLLVPTGFLALLGLPEFLLVAPGLSINFLAQHHCQAEIYCHYTVPVIPFVHVATVVGLQRLSRLLKHRLSRSNFARPGLPNPGPDGDLTIPSDQILNLLRLSRSGFARPGSPDPGQERGFGNPLGAILDLLRLVFCIMGLAILPLTIAALTLDNPFTEDQELPAPLAHLPNAEAVRRALATVPPAASVVTTNAYAPHLAQREALHVIGIPTQRDPPLDPEIVLVNLYDQRFIVCEQYRDYFTQLDIDRYGVLFRD